MIDSIIPALIKTLLERYPKPFAVSFKLTSSSQDGNWEMELNAGVPETCAAVAYKGEGRSTAQALADLSMNVILDRPAVAQANYFCMVPTGGTEGNCTYPDNFHEKHTKG